MICFAGTAMSQSPLPAPHSEFEIESAMLYNFTRFVEWPEGALGPAGSPVVVGVVDGGEMAPILEQALANRTVGGHPIRVRRLNAGADLKSCAVLLVGSSGRQEIMRVVQSVERLPVLTIGEKSEFSKLGGIIAFIRDGNHIRFEINLDAAGRAQLQISSKLLRLAEVRRESPAVGSN